MVHRPRSSDDDQWQYLCYVFYDDNNGVDHFVIGDYIFPGRLSISRMTPWKRQICPADSCIAAKSVHNMHCIYMYSNTQLLQTTLRREYQEMLLANYTTNIRLVLKWLVSTVVEHLYIVKIRDSFIFSKKVYKNGFFEIYFTIIYIKLPLSF